MKKTLLIVALAASLFLSGCSKVSQEEGNSTLIESTDNSNVLKNDERKEQFATKCKEQIEQLEQLYAVFSDDFQINEASVQCPENDMYTSKIYVAKTGANNNEDRMLMSFLEIYSDDEYEFFQATKEFISFVDENALDIAGRDQFMISINIQDNGTPSIAIMCQEDEVSIIYADRGIRSAYSDRFKSIDLFAECEEQIALPGLIKFDDLPNSCTPYDISCEYGGKTLTHKWYKIDDFTTNNTFVTYIDDGSYNDITDEELIYYAYISAFDPDNTDDSKMISEYYFAYQSGETVVCSIRYMKLFKNLNSFSCNWINEYEYLNDNEFNVNLKNSIIEQIDQ